jgi:hypothetical protein
MQYRRVLNCTSLYTVTKLGCRRCPPTKPRTRATALLRKRNSDIMLATNEYSALIGTAKHQVSAQSTLAEKGNPRDLYTSTACATGNPPEAENGKQIAAVYDEGVLCDAKDLKGATAAVSVSNRSARASTQCIARHLCHCNRSSTVGMDQCSSSPQVLSPLQRRHLTAPPQPGPGAAASRCARHSPR